VVRQAALRHDGEPMRNPEVEERWHRIERGLRSELARASSITVRIPRWQPTDISTGLRWLQGIVYEGFYVDYLVEHDNSGQTTVWLKSWEYWDPDDPSPDEEPTWQQVKAIPISPPDPNLEIR
jgi:hypothetical protein